MACKVCQKTFTLPSDDEYDSDAKPHVCPTCGQSFSLKIQLKRHTLLHANGEPFTCINCSKDGENEEEDEDSISYNLRLSKKGDFNCEVCNMTFSSKRLLLRHTSDEHSLESSHFCDDCPEIFETAADLKKHAATHKTTKSVAKKRASTKSESNGSKSLSCPHCSKTFAYQASWDKHVSKCGSGEDSAKTPRKRRSSTDSYDEPSSSKKSKKSFVEVHENSSQKHECDVCGKSFKRKSALDGHMITHINEEEEESDNDNSNDDVIPAYKKKKSEAHDSEPKDQNVGGIKRSFICIKCNFVCFSQATLVKHVCRRDREEAAAKKETKKTGPPPKPKPKNFKCSICCHSFELLEELKLHRLTHTPEGHTCEICDRSFRSEKRLKKHYKSHNVEVDDDSDVEEMYESTKPRRKHSNRSKDYECNLCGKRFAGERCLQKHVEKHEESGETVPKKRRKRSKANETLTCSFCDEEFVGRKTQYLKHMAVHTPEVCGICDERFVDRQGLREHCKVHVGTKEGQMFMECSQKALDAKLGLLPPEPKVEYIYLVLR
ncbi:hypothetical protein JTE90_012972 [Oedothorax gibbosus]|uniref:C2H2-type domain-containing protein n=1 Tax=Oedothorax gibbosus TaxID=931172 RepID=A0AAV6UAT1_9ARAC|nr:hypothetical protein JTE90_012972 [Oedothorax gibbosus]